MEGNLILMNLAAFGLPTLVVFVGGLWYWNKRSQEIIPPIEKDLKDLKEKVTELSYKNKNLESEIERNKTEIGELKNDLKVDKKKIYDMLDSIKETQAMEKSDIKSCLAQLTQLTQSFNAYISK